jgi:hypothetical protein
MDTDSGSDSDTDTDSDSDSGSGSESKTDPDPGSDPGADRGRGCAEPDCDGRAAVRLHVPWAGERDVCPACARALAQQDGVVAEPLVDPDGDNDGDGSGDGERNAGDAWP